MATTIQLLLKIILKVIKVKYIYKYILPKKLKTLVEPVSSNIRIFSKVLSGNPVPLGLFSVLIFIKLRYIRLQIILIQVSGTKGEEQGALINILSIYSKLISLLILVRSNTLQPLSIAYKYIQELLVLTTINQLLKFI